VLNGNNLPTYSPFWDNVTMTSKIYVCPADSTNTPTTGSTFGGDSYGINAQVMPIGWNPYGHYPTTIMDGTSNTIFYTEQRAACAGYWPDWGPSLADPNWPQPTGPASIFLVQPLPISSCPFGSNTQFVAVSPHTGGINVGMGDGSVHLVSQSVNPNTWWAALTPSGGEVLGSDW